jgi:hypothetical protein
LYVTGKSPAGFEVRELRTGTSNLAFRYRIVAKRKDVEGPRLEKIDLKNLRRHDAPTPPLGSQQGH